MALIGESAMSQSKLVVIRLAAYTRVEYREVLEVPAAMSDSDLQELVNQRFSDVDVGEFTDNPMSWERGPCSYEEAIPDDRPTGRLVDGEVVPA